MKMIISENSKKMLMQHIERKEKEHKEFNSRFNIDAKDLREYILSQISIKMEEIKNRDKFIPHNAHSMNNANEIAHYSLMLIDSYIEEIQEIID